MAVEWKAFDLRPGTPPEGLPRPDTADQQAGQPLAGNAGKAALDAGLLMRRASITPFTRPAMAAGEYAKEHGKFDDYHRRLFKAYWEDGKNLGDISVLKEEAERVDLDSKDLGQALEEGRYDAEVEHQVRFAHEVGITGIPAFIVDSKYLFTGAQPYQFFKQVVDQVIEERESPPPEGKAPG